MDNKGSYSRIRPSIISKNREIVNLKNPAKGSLKNQAIYSFNYFSLMNSNEPGNLYDYLL